MMDRHQRERDQRLLALEKSVREWETWFSHEELFQDDAQSRPYLLTLHPYVGSQPMELDHGAEAQAHSPTP